MKKMYILLVALSILPLAIDVNAQEWCKPGSQWYYWEPAQMSSMVYPHNDKSISDTLIKNRLCYKTSFRPACANLDMQNEYTYIHSRNDSVFFYCHVSEDFRLLYDFTKKTGESYKIYPLYGDYKDYLEVTIDSVKIQNINNSSVRVQYVSTLSHSEQSRPNLWVIGNVGSTKAIIIEHVGSTSYFIPQESGWCDNWILGICSYEGGDNFVYKVDNKDCSQPYDSSIGIGEYSNIYDVSIYPNPTFNTVNIQSTQDFQVIIFDICGKRIGAFEVKADIANTFDFSNHLAGSYFVRLQSNQKVFTKKIIRL